MSISPNILITPNQFLSAAQRIAIIRLAILAQVFFSDRAASPAPASPPHG